MLLFPCASHIFCLHMFTQVSAVISIPLWQWFLQRFGKKTAAFCGITVSILFLFWSARAALKPTSEAALWCLCHLVGRVRNAASLSESQRRTLKMLLNDSLPLSSGSCPSPWCWSSSPTLWWPMLWLSPLDSVWPPRSCCHGTTLHHTLRGAL